MTQPFYTHVMEAGSKMLHRYVDEHGIPQIEICKHQFRYFIPSNNGSNIGLYGDKLQEFTEITPHKFREKFQDWEKIHQKVHGMKHPDIQFISDNYPGKIQFDFSKIKILDFDIETEVGNGFPDPEKAEHEITVITCALIGKKESITWTTLDYREELDDETSPNNIIILCDNEFELLDKFINWYDNLKPDALTGWNIESFDIPYLINRMKKIHPRKVDWISPVHEYVNTAYKEKPHPSNGNQIYKISGISILDYIDVYKKFTYGSSL